MEKPLPTPELLRKLLRYEPDTGKLYWRERTPDMFEDGRMTARQKCRVWNGKFVGREALKSVTSFGYKFGEINGCRHRAHRVIWAISNGEWPTNQIDHINGDMADQSDQ